MIQLTGFGKKIKMALIAIGKPQYWLIEKVSEETGLYFDDSYLHKVLTGKVAPKKIIDAICKILDIEEPDMDDAKTKN